MLISLQQLIDTYKLKPRGVLHCGAHWGEEAEDYHAAGINHVVWIEANPEVLPKLRENVNRFCPEIIEACLSDVDGAEVTFHVTQDPERTAMSSSMLELDLHRKYAPWVKEHHQLTLKTTRIDTLADQNPQWSTINFMNLDLQGAELLALKGGERFLAHVEWVYTEVNSGSLYKDCVLLPELDEWMSWRGFQRLETRMTDCEWGDALYARTV